MQALEIHQNTNLGSKTKTLSTDSRHLDALQYDEVAKQFVASDFDELIAHMQACSFANTYRSRLRYQVELKFHFFQAHIVSCALTFFTILFLATILIRSYA